MAFSKDTIKKAEAFVAGKMPVEEAQAFKRLLAQDADLADLVEQLKIENYIFQVGAELDLRDQIKGWSEEVITKKAEDENRLRWGLLFTAVLAVVAFVFFIMDKRPAEDPPTEQVTPAVEIDPYLDSLPENITRPDSLQIAQRVEEPEGRTSRSNAPKDFKRYNARANRTPSNDNENEQLLALLAEQPLLPAELDLQMRSASVTTEIDSISYFDRGKAAFREGEYQLAINYFNTSITTSLAQESTPNNKNQLTKRQRWLAHAYLANAEHENAASLFAQLAQHPSLDIRDAAEWYWTLSLLPSYNEQRNTVDSLLQFMTTPANEHGYFKPADVLRSRLEDLRKE